jgi:hypothetical protein
MIYSKTSSVLRTVKIDMSANTMVGTILNELTSSSASNFDTSYAVYTSATTIYYVGKTTSASTTPSATTYTKAVGFMMLTDPTQSCITFSYLTDSAITGFSTTVAALTSINVFNLGSRSVTYSTITPTL